MRRSPSPPLLSRGMSSSLPVHDAHRKSLRMHPPVSDDEQVRETNNDALLAKWSATSAGYYDDPFLSLFLRPSKKDAIQRFHPIIHRGYFLRVASLRRIISRFLRLCMEFSSLQRSDCFDDSSMDAARPCSQIVSLGAGFDTTFFCLDAGYLLPEDRPAADVVDAPSQTDSFSALTCVYAEVDFPTVMDHKQRVVEQYLSHSRGSRSSMDGIENESTRGNPSERKFISSEDQLLLPLHQASPFRFEFRSAGVDLRMEASDLRKLFLDVLGLDSHVPTLFISECVLAYLSADDSDRVLLVARSCFDLCSVFMYEQVNADDPFGRSMISNLQERGCPLLSIERYRNVPYLQARFRDLGFLSKSEIYLLEELVLRGREPRSSPSLLRIGSQDSVSSSSSEENRCDTSSIHVEPYLIDPEEWLRIQKIEWLDEVEEWNLFQQHYYIALLLSVVPDLESSDILGRFSSLVQWYRFPTSFSLAMPESFPLLVD